MSDEEILAAARRCFRERGPNVSVGAIARLVGVSGQALLNRFGSKERLMIEALRPPERPPWIDELARGPDGRPLGAQLLDVVRTLSSFFAEMAHQLLALQWGAIAPRDLIGYRDPPPVRGMAALAAWLQRAHRRGLIRKVDFEATALALLGALQTRNFLEQVLERAPSRHTREEYERAVARLFERALARDPGGRS